MADAAFLGPGKTVVAAEPTFEAVFDSAAASRPESVKVPLTADFRHDLPKMAAACDASHRPRVRLQPEQPHRNHRVTGDEVEALRVARLRRRRPCWSTRPITTSSKTRATRLGPASSWTATPTIVAAHVLEDLRPRRACASATPWACPKRSDRPRRLSSRRSATPTPPSSPPPMASLAGRGSSSAVREIGSTERADGSRRDSSQARPALRFRPTPNFIMIDVGPRRDAVLSRRSRSRESSSAASSRRSPSWRAVRSARGMSEAPRRPWGDAGRSRRGRRCPAPRRRRPPCLARAGRWAPTPSRSPADGSRSPASCLHAVRRSLTTWILVSMIVGAEIGHDWPEVGVVAARPEPDLPADDQDDHRAPPLRRRSWWGSRATPT